MAPPASVLPVSSCRRKARRTLVWLLIVLVALFVAASATESSLASSQPRFPIRAAFYYPWYPQTWTVGGESPHFTPSLGHYDSADPSVIQRHIRALRYGGIKAGIASWWGRGSRTDAVFPALLRQAARTRFRWAVYFEHESMGDPSPRRIRRALRYIKRRYGAKPAYLRVRGRFVVFVYADGNDRCGMARRWHRANVVGAYVVLKVFPGYRTCGARPDSWHQYSPAVADDSQGRFSYSVSPGFWKADEATPRLERDLDRWRASVRRMAGSRARWKLVTTFNEWGEGTAVESAREWATSSGFGAYLDALHANAGDPVIAAAGDIACDPADASFAGLLQFRRRQLAHRCPQLELHERPGRVRCRLPAGAVAAGRPGRASEHVHPGVRPPCPLQLRS